MERKSIGAKARFEIFKRDRFTCQYCGGHPPNAVLRVDHIVAVANGGNNDPDNLVTACSVCNGGKGARSLNVIPQSLAERANEVQEREAQLRGYHKIMERSRKRRERDVWRVARMFTDQFSREQSIPRDWLLSIGRFVDALGVHECIASMEGALNRQPYNSNQCFRYFCGTCWNKIRECAA